MTGTNQRRVNPGGADEPTIWPRVAYFDWHIDRSNSRAVSGACCGMRCSTLKPEPQPPRRRFRRLHRALEMRARPRSQRHKLKQTPWRLHLPYRPARRTPMSPCPSSTLPALSERVTRSLPAGLRQARSWNYCATASAMIERSQISPDNSSWSLPGFPLGTTS